MLMGVFSSAPTACRWRRRSTRPRSSCGSTSASLRRCSRTRTCSYVFRAAGALRPVRRGLVHVPQRERQEASSARSPKDLQGRDHLRGRPLRRRRRRRATRPACKKSGMQVVLKEGYSATAPDLSRLVTKLQARARRRDPAHRLQPRHHAVPAPGARAGAEVGGADRPRRRLRPVRQADARPSATTSTTSSTSIRSPRSCSTRRRWRRASAT